VLFEPKSPVTKARLRDVEREEGRLDLQAMTNDAAAAAEVRALRFP